MATKPVSLVATVFEKELLKTEGQTSEWWAGYRAAILQAQYLIEKTYQEVNEGHREGRYDTGAAFHLLCKRLTLTEKGG